MLDDPLVVSPLTFTVYHTPPRVVPRGSVLVQVWAAGLDGVDARIVGAGLQLVPAPATVLADAEEKGAPDGVGTDADVDAKKKGGLLRRRCDKGRLGWGKMERMGEDEVDDGPFRI